MATPVRREETCERCRGLARERDEALGQLAREREKVNALRAGLGVGAADDPPQYPGLPAVGPPPMRYVLVDGVNTRLKQLLGPFHRAGKQAAQLSLRLLAGLRR